jgi:hypothetical protein
MAYVRKEQETIDFSYEFTKVWSAIPKALDSLGWSVESVDESAHRVRGKTRGRFMGYGSMLLIEATPIDEGKTKVSVAAETPVTTITSLADFGDTRKRVEIFFLELREQLK